MIRFINFEYISYAILLLSVFYTSISLAKADDKVMPEIAGIWFEDIHTNYRQIPDEYTIIAQKTNRYGHPLGLYRNNADDIWQYKILTTGQGRFFPSKLGTEFDQPLWQAEQIAIRKNRGSWQNQWRVLSADRITEDDIYNFQIIKGTIHNTATYRHRTYLNFADNWRKDMTVMLPKSKTDAVLQQLAVEHLEALHGLRVQIRGWLFSYNGPMIELTYPQQIWRMESPTLIMESQHD